VDEDNPDLPDEAGEKGAGDATGATGGLGGGSEPRDEDVPEHERPYQEGLDLNALTANVAERGTDMAVSKCQPPMWGRRPRGRPVPPAAPVTIRFMSSLWAHALARCPRPPAT
jgi:hypothetical protein